MNVAYLVSVDPTQANVGEFVQFGISLNIVKYRVTSNRLRITEKEKRQNVQQVKRIKCKCIHTYLWFGRKRQCEEPKCWRIRTIPMLNEVNPPASTTIQVASSSHTYSVNCRIWASNKILVKDLVLVRRSGKNQNNRAVHVGKRIKSNAKQNIFKSNNK